MTTQEYKNNAIVNRWVYRDMPIEEKIDIAKWNSDTIRLLTFQSADIWGDIYNNGIYYPWASAGHSYGDEIEKQIDKLGYYPVWAFNPLSALSYEFNPYWFTDIQFTHTLWERFQRMRKEEWKNLALFELEIKTKKLDVINTDDFVTTISAIPKSYVVAIYQFFINDRDREYPTTDKLPYIKVLRRFSESAMLKEDFSPAIWSGKYTGDDSLDFD